MATTPNPMQQGMDEQPEDGMQPDNDAGQIAELCIGVMQDGSLTVYKETGPEGQETETPRQTVSDIGQALKAVLDLYRQLDTGGKDAATQFDDGFGNNEGGQARMARGFR